jgi:hypothetical protein
MAQSFFDQSTDLAWLANTHMQPFSEQVMASACAILHGNEDAPEKVELFAVNDYRCMPTVFVQNESGNLVNEADV